MDVPTCLDETSTIVPIGSIAVTLENINNEIK